MNADQFWNLAGIALTVVGWFAAFWFGLRQQRANTKESAKLKVYEDFWKQRGSLHDCASTLSTLLLTGVPFGLMEMDENTMTYPLPSRPLVFTADQQAAMHRYAKFLEELRNAQAIFQERFMDFWRSLEMWMNIIPVLEPAIKILTSEYSDFQEVLNQLINKHIALPVIDWKAWDREDLKKRHKEVWDQHYRLVTYIDDMMGLIHNELVTPIFGYERAQRMPQDPTYKVLTKKGLVVVKKN